MELVPGVSPRSVSVNLSMSPASHGFFQVADRPISP
jgi:hypothetical protein